MDPTVDELEQLNSLSDVCDWAGLEDPLKAKLFARLGAPTKIRDIGFIGRPKWDAEVEATKLEAADGSEIDLTAVQTSRVEIFRRVCLRRLGMTPDVPGATGPPGGVIGGYPPQAVAAPGLGAAATTGMTRKLKLSAIIDPTLDAEVVQIDRADVQQMYSDYKAKYGDYPSQDSDPSLDQLSALRQLILAESLPYCDLSIFGPHGLRILRKQVFTAYMVSSGTGEWTKKELPGPPDYHAWHKGYKVFRTAMLLLRAADAERLDAYAEHLRDLVHQFMEECWGLIYRADVRMRSENMDRLRRHLTEKPEHGFTTNDPWSAVYAAAVRDEKFWAKEVLTPCTLLLAGRRNAAGAAAHRGVDDERADPGAGRRPKKRPKKTHQGEDKSVYDPATKRYTHNRKGLEICRNYGEGKCGDGRPQGKCQGKTVRSHQCDRCLGPHMGKDCTNPKAG